MLRRRHDTRDRGRAAGAERVRTSREANQGFEQYLDASLPRLSDELHLELSRFRRRVEAYWNGCAWVT